MHAHTSTRADRRTLDLIAIALTALVSALTAFVSAQEQRIILNGVEQQGPAAERILNEVARGGAAGGASIPLGSGLIAGQIVDASSARPVAGAIVTLRLGGQTPLRALADAQGRFVFQELPAGSYAADATRSGYIDGANGRLRPRGSTRPIVLEEGGRITDARIVLWKQAAIAGTVLDEAGEPMIGVNVRVLQKTTTGGMTRLAMGATDRTDDRGVFRITGLEPGEYVVCVPMSYQGALISAFEEIGRTGRGGLDAITTALPVAGPIAFGNDNGSISISLDSEGSTSAGMDGNGKPLAYPTWYYPAAISPSRAAVVTLTAGEEQTGIDFQIRPLPTTHLTGSVVSPSGPVGPLALTLVPAQTGDLVSPIEAATARTNENGAFTFDGVPQGEYVLRAVSGMRGAAPVNFSFALNNGNAEMRVERMVVAGGPDVAVAPPAPPPPPPANASSPQWALVPVTADRADITGLVITLRQGFTVSGQTDWAGAAARPDATAVANIAVSLDPADARTASMAVPVQGRFRSDGTFTTPAVVPGRYVLRVSGLPRGWVYRGATIAGRDIADLPFEIENGDVGGVTVTLTDRLSQITGTVTTSTGGALDETAVIVFPADREAWSGYGTTARRVKNVRADAKGAYRIDGLPPGRYLIAAVNDATAADWQSPDFLATLSASASPVELGVGQTATQSLKAVR